MEKTCKNCNYPVDNQFCPNCGQKTSVSRFTMKHLLQDFIHGFFHIDHGIFLTIYALAKNPGVMLKNYLNGHRIRYFNPFTFILILGGISAVLLPLVHWKTIFIDLGILANHSVDQDIWNSSLKHFSIRLLLLIPLYALVTRIFYLKKDYNFSEHLVVNTYIRGELCIIMIIFSPMELIIHDSQVMAALKLFFLLVNLIYTAWAYAGVFDDRITVWGLVKGFFAVLVSMLCELTIINLVVSK